MRDLSLSVRMVSLSLLLTLEESSGLMSLVLLKRHGPRSFSVEKERPKLPREPSELLKKTLLAFRDREKLPHERLVRKSLEKKDSKNSVSLKRRERPRERLVRPNARLNLKDSVRLLLKRSA